MMTGNFGPQVWHRYVGEIWGATQKDVKTTWHEYMEEGTKDRKMFDDMGIVPPDIWQQMDEGRDIPRDEVTQGYITHYVMQKWGQALNVTEEMELFGQYEEIYNMTKNLSYTEKLTEDYQAVGFLNGSFGTTATGIGGDGKAHITTDHPLKGGGTWSNEAAVPLAPSNTALGAMIVQIEKTPAENGRIDSTMKATKVVGPAEYQFRFAEILKSTQKDDTANNAINALKGKLSSEYVSVPLTTSSLNWWVKTNSGNGLKWFWGRKPRFRKVSHEQSESTTFMGSFIAVQGFTNPRDLFGFQWE